MKRKRNLIAVILIVSLLAGIQSTQKSKAIEVRPGFSYGKISKEVKSQMKGVSMPKKGAKISFSELRMITVKYYNMKGKTKVGYLVVNKKIAAKVTNVFVELYDIKYRIEKMRLVDYYGADDVESMSDNNTSAFNYRTIAGTNKLSKHGMGMAIDINPRINPCVKGSSVEPANGKVYTVRNRKKCKGKYKKYMILKNDKVYKIFKKYGFTWGGDWNSLKDYQHFEI